MTNIHKFKMIDYRDVQNVEVLVCKTPSATDTRYDLWINIDGVCRLRVKNTSASDFSIDLPKELKEALSTST